MNVSSVKNLNGETFSAVQDAALTNVVQTNSGSWNDTSDVVQTNSASWSFIPTYEYTDGDLISAIDTSGLYATSAGIANSALWIPAGKRLDQDIYWSGSEAAMYLNPRVSPFTTTSGVYGMLQYATGACLDYYSQSKGNQYYGGFFKGNQWFISDHNPNFTNIGALMGEIHKTRSVNISGSLTGGAGFVLHPDHVSGRGNSPTTNSWKLDRISVSGLNSTGSWKYGVEEDTALRTVSALEYNAVDEISGIAGSAIAQYGAEKQWLQHDDTIVHVANSAQYAFGVNVSALQQLMGIDETVLWSGSQTLNNEITLSESRLNFNSLKMWYSPSNSENGNVGVMEIPMMGANTGTNFNLESNVAFSTGTAAGFNIHWTYYVSATDTKMKVLNAFWWGKQNAGGLDGASGTWGQGTNQQCPRVFKIIGIGRKA